MKKILLVFIAVFAFSCSSDDSGTVDPVVTNPEPENPAIQCANVYNGDIKLSSQAELNAFAAYNYCGIKGSLSISPGGFDTTTDITTLVGLESLKYVTGYLSIQNNSVLANLKGLDNLEEVFFLSVSYNDILVDFEGLGSLRKIVGNDSMHDMYDIKIHQNNSLKNLKGLGPIKVAGGFSIMYNDELLSLEGFETLEEIRKFAFVGNNIKLASLKGLNNLKSTHALSISNNYSFTSIEDLGSLEKANFLYFTNLERLVSLKGLENLKELNGLLIWYLTSLENLEGVQNLKQLAALQLYGNISLKSIEHLSGITVFLPNDEEITINEIGIGGNHSLTSLNGLQNITTFEGDLKIENNDVLNNLCALQNFLGTGVFTSPVKIKDNAYNPTVEDILAGNCSE